MQGNIEKKNFVSDDSLLNADDAPYAISPNSWVNAENFRFASTDKDATNAGQFIGGTRLLSTPQPSINYLAIGSASDDENGRFAEFKFNTTGRQDKIVAYYKSTGIEYDVLLSSQVTGGLNFSKNSPIHSANIINGMLYWVDGINNQPRKINLESAIKANNPSFVTDEVPYTFPLNFSEITRIKPPPPLSPNISKNFDVTYANNFIANDSFEFAFQYSYYDNETTVTGGYSPASKLNFALDVFNRIIVTMDIFELIPSTVRLVNLVVRFGNSNQAAVIKTWDKEVASENTEIQNQNNGVSVLAFNYYNDISGIYLAEDEVLRPFDTVPIYSHAQDFAKQRGYLANNIDGYGTPLSTSMSMALGSMVTIQSPTQTTNLIFVLYETQNGATTDFGYAAWYVYLSWASIPGYYAITSTEGFYTPAPFPFPIPAKPTTVAYTTGLTYRGANWSEIVANTRPAGSTSPIITTPQSPIPNASLITITGISLNNYAVVAQNSPFKGGTVFYDFAMRKCGVVTNDGVVVTSPFRDFAYSTAYTSIDWILSNGTAVTEIPDWAYYYAPVLTLNQRTRLFIQSETIAAKYATKDTDGKYQFNSDIFLPNVVGIGLNTAAINQSGLGYVFNEGDQCILIRDDNTIYQLPVVGQDGNYIIVKSTDAGNLNGRNFVFEIYSPYQASTQEPYFEMGNIYQILNPGTPQRSYSVISGSFPPDAFALTRSFNNNTYIAGAMSPNDLFYKRWDNDGGKPNYVTKLGQSFKTQYISWSDTFIPNTAINGLSTFRGLNQTSVPEDCGGISKIVLTSKVQSEGSVMLAICANETCSLYLQETQIIDSTGGTQFFASSDKVISTINVLKGSRGTTHAESVVEFRGNVYWWDDLNNRIVQYSLNGLFDISDYKMTRFWNQFTLQFNSMTASEIEVFGGRPFVFGAVDPFHEELLFSIPKLSDTPPKGFLPDYPNTVYPFDILDFRGKTIVYKLDLGAGKPKWLGAFSFNPENFIMLQSELYANKNGHLYLHNQPNYNEFYGVQYSSKIMVVANQALNNPKVYNNVASESNLVPSFVYFYSSYPIQQASDLVDNDFANKEGVFYATIFRNKLVPTATGYETTGLLTGEKMRNTAMYIMFEWRANTTPLQLKFVNIGYQQGLGQPVTTNG
jgi:hypothetical protein